MQSDERFRIETAIGETGTVLTLVGELDLISMPQFEEALARAVSLRPTRLIFDITVAQFICGQAFAAIGRCSLELDDVVVCARNRLAERLLRAFGYDAITS